MYEKLQTAIDAGLFTAGLIKMVRPPPLEEIIARSNQLPIPIRPEHIQLLQEWGGSILDEIRINGVDEVRCDGVFVEFANDYNGFIFKYDQTGAVYAEDTDGGLIQKIATDIREFINEVFLGKKCLSFYGSDWLEELRRSKLV